MEKGNSDAALLDYPNPGYEAKNKGKPAIKEPYAP